MFAKVECSKNMFLSIRMMFCSHLAYPKQVFAYTSLSKLIKNQIFQNFDQKSSKMLVITAIFAVGAFLGSKEETLEASARRKVKAKRRRVGADGLLDGELVGP